MDSYEAGYDAVWNGHSKALISIPGNFTKALGERGLDQMAADDALIDMSTISLYLDMSCKYMLHFVNSKKTFFLYNPISRFSVG